ncbi:MAG: hypothetical protein J2P28_13075 [Actinobacteria bacterium]|nr:hypothetical protein [Actinomycetota bacterium]MBO0836421.1 hypothetical protein [Actinomycetota bacterium]
MAHRLAGRGCAVALSALATVAAASACGASANRPPPAATSAPAPQPPGAETGVSFSDFRSVECTLLGPGEDNDPRLVFEVHLQVKAGITVRVHSLTIQWHRKYFAGPVVATETDPVGAGKPPVTNRLLWAYAWPSTAGLTSSENGATGPNPVACTVQRISGTATTSGSRS